MEFFDFGGLAGPVPNRVLPFTPELALQSAVLGTVLVGAVGILWSSLRRAIAREKNDSHATSVAPNLESLRLVVPARPARVARRTRRRR